MRLFTELAVIVLGVLIALAADRWSQERQDIRDGAEYLERITAEIRADSVQMEESLAVLSLARSARDTLQMALAGAPVVMHQRLLQLAVYRVVLPPPVAWAELNNTGLLRLLGDTEVRTAVTRYYAQRDRAEDSMQLGARRGRDPLLDVVYQLGLFDGNPTEEEFAEFRALPSATQLLIGLGGHHFVTESFTNGLLSEAGSTLRTLAER